jgi:hypothetical protein
MNPHNMYINPEKVPEIHARNLKKFKQVIDDLTDIYNRCEAGELDDIWFIRRLSAAQLGVTWMTDTDGKRYSISWKDGKMIKCLDESPTIDLRAAYARVRARLITGADPICDSKPRSTLPPDHWRSRIPTILL